MADDSEVGYEDVVDAGVEDAVESEAAGAEPGGSLFSKLGLDTLAVEKLFTGNTVAVCMAVIIATVLVFLMYKVMTRQSRRDKAKEAKKKLKQQKNSKENKKKV